MYHAASDEGAHGEQLPKKMWNLLFGVQPAHEEATFVFSNY